MSQRETTIYVGWIIDHEVLMKSSSGGAYTVLSDVFLENGDAVISAIYNYQTHTTEFKMIHNKQDRNQARGSKYMQSKPGNIFQEAYLWIKQNPDRKILFVGMGCQAEGFRKYAEFMGIRQQVYIVDIVCYGSSSPKLWREYAELLERSYGGKITYLTFRDKRNGWKSPTAFAVVNNMEIPINDYMNVFYNQCALRPSCHECPYATVERRTDLTIGDSWHIEETIADFYNENGSSLFLIHTNQGEALFESVKDKLEYRLSNMEQCWQTNLETPTTVSEKRGKFWSDYQKEGIRFIMWKYGMPSLMMRIKKGVSIVIQRINALYIAWGGGKTEYRYIFPGIHYGIYLMGRMA
mgnify:CR=1 FL=1